ERRLVLPLRDEVQLSHTAEHIRTARLGVLRAVDRVADGGTLGDTCENRGIRHRKLGKLLTEIRLGSSRHAIGLLTEEGEMEEQLQNLFLGELTLDTQRKNQFLELANERYAA